MEAQTEGNNLTSQLGPILPPALRYPAFWVFWLGSTASVSGFQILRFSQFWLMFQLTGSPLSLGYLGLASTAPVIVFAPLGGVLADKLDMRRLIMVTQGAIASLIFLLATLTLLDMVEGWHVLTIAFLISVLDAIDAPVRHALYPNLVDREAMMSAVALNSAIWQVARFFVPAMSGFIISFYGTTTTFYLAGLGFLTMAAFMYGLRGLDIPRSEGGLLEVLKSISEDSMFPYLMAMTFFSVFFGMAYVALMPVFAVEILEIGARGQGLLLGMSTLGGLVTMLLLAYWSTVRYQGLLAVGGTVLFGISVAAFALTSEYVGWFPLALMLMFVLGVLGTTRVSSVSGDSDADTRLGWRMPGSNPSGRR